MKLNELSKSVSYALRDYQDGAVSAAINWMKKNSEPALLELATGAGKSLICADIARIMRILSNKKVLCLCPTAELVEQNAEKFSLTGEDFSVYSASIGKSLINDVVFATEGTFKSVAEEHGGRFSCVILDEAHRITPTIKKIIDQMRAKNPLLRVIGMTATPYRLGTGYIYAIDQAGRKVDEAKDPYFKKLIYSVGGDYLVKSGYLTEPKILKGGVSGYKTEKLLLKSNGTFDQKVLDEVFVGQGRKTAEIVADVVGKSSEFCCRGVMFFAATVKHAEEIIESLPAYNSALVTGDTPKKERKQIIKDYKDQKIKYLVNVSVLTTGFDAPHTDMIAVLRASESASLLSQIYGRGLRLYEGKKYCYILDYAGNIENFFPSGDIFDPTIKAYGQKPAKKIEVKCPCCSGINIFSMRQGKEYTEYQVNSAGNFVNQLGREVMAGDVPMPAHYGRRCKVIKELGKNQFQRCSHYWAHKKCHKCEWKNDIAARVCENCDHQLIDPNSKLSIDFQVFKADLTKIQTDKIKSVLRKQVRSGLYLVIFETEYRKFEAFFSDRVNSKFKDFVINRNSLLKTVSYKKTDDGKNFIIVDFNRKEDLDDASA